MVFKAKSVDEYFLAQDLSLIEETMSKSKIVLEEIISKIKPGKKESEILALTKEIYLDHGIHRSWHNPYIRFGANTLLTYADKAIEDLTLKEEDIAFVDIGPIFGDIEGDLGRTICFGENKLHKNIIEASESLFEEGLKFFKEKNSWYEQCVAFDNNDKKNITYYKNKINNSSLKKYSNFYNINKSKTLEYPMNIETYINSISKIIKKNNGIYDR